MERIPNLVFGKKELAVFTEEEFLMLDNKNTLLAIDACNLAVIESLRKNFDNYFFSNLIPPP
jgi:hypothetical protein